MRQKSSSFYFASKKTNSSFGSQSHGRGSFHGQSSRGGSRRPRRDEEKIDINRFIQQSSNRKPVEAPIISHKFSDFNLSPIIQKNLAHQGFVTPTPIQDQSIDYIMSGRDLVGLANTGTGKTAAFLLPLINKTFLNKNERVLIIAPTRELAIQIENEFRLFSWGMQLFSGICTGGSPIGKQIFNLKRNPNFVIGTPGRLKDLSERGLIRFESFTNVVLDEVDRMMDMGFVDEITRILNKLPQSRQSLFFSATMPPKIANLVKQFQTDPITVSVTEGETAKNVEQDIIRVRSRESKIIQLQDLLRDPEVKKALIFSETKRDVDRISSDLVKEGFLADCIHGDKRQSQRARALNSFKRNEIKILVATDVAARGLDIKDISHVINYTVPQTYNDYVHRIGRTGRGEKSGKALTFVE